MGKVIKIVGILCLVIFSLIGCSNSEVKDSQSMAEKFVKELYTVDLEEIDNYNEFLNSKNNDIDVFNEEIESMHKNLKPLMTEDAYSILLNNRINLAFIQLCAEGNYVMQVTDFSLSKTTDNTDGNNEGYKFEAKLKFISNKDKTEQEDVGKGYVGLTREGGKWKISGYKINELPKVLEGSLTNNAN
nr:hypothetical protein [Sedimentibacter sp.]